MAAGYRLATLSYPSRRITGYDADADRFPDPSAVLPQPCRRVPGRRGRCTSPAVRGVRAALRRARGEAFLIGCCSVDHGLSQVRPQIPSNGSACDTRHGSAGSPRRGPESGRTSHPDAAHRSWPTARPILDDGRRRQPVPGQLLLLRRHYRDYREPTIERMNLSFLRRKRQPLSIPSQPRARRKISVARQRDGVYALPEADFAPETSGTSDISMPIAVTELGDDIVWRPEADLWPHLHLEGLIGSGKTITAQNIAVAAARARWRVHILRQSTANTESSSVGPASRWRPPRPNTVHCCSEAST